MRIGVDCDGVLYHWERTARYMLRRKLENEGRPIPRGLHLVSQHWDHVKDHVEAEDWKWLWSRGVELGLFRYGHVIGGSLEGLEGLSKLGGISIITSRPPGAVKDTLAWLSLMTDKIELRGIHILSHGQPKSEVHPQPDVLIDDGLHNVEDMAMNTDADVIVFDQPWNREMPTIPDGAVAGLGLYRPEDMFERVYRAYNWREVVSLVKSLKEDR